VPNISMHIRNIFKEEELVKEATVKNFLIVQIKEKNIKSFGSVERRQKKY
jgi:hypothetical protein